MLKKYIQKLKPHHRINRLYLLGILVCFFVLLGARLHVDHFTTGDEPHYLLMDYSLKNDKDLNLKNNYINKDYWQYYPEYIPPHVSHLNLENEASGWYSFHGIGLPLLIFPFFLIAEKSGPMVFMTLVATATVALAVVWAFIVTRNKRASVLAGVALLCCYFFNGLSGYLYPDLLITLLTLGSFIILGSGIYRNKFWQLSLGLILGAMVFIHFRTIALALPIAAAFFYLHWRAFGRKIPWPFLTPGILLAVLFFFTLHRWFGVWEPNAIYSSHVGVSIKSLINTPAILFDSLRGSLAYNPILFVVPIGLPLWYKYSKRTFMLLITLLPILFVIFGFNEWHGGYSPNGRYLMSILPVLLPAVCLFYIYAKDKFHRAVFYALLACTFVISIFAILIKQPYTGYSTRSEIFIDIEKYTQIPIDKAFPTYYFIDNSLTDRYGAIQAVFWMIVLVSLFVYGVILTKRKSGVLRNGKRKRQ